MFKFRLPRKNKPTNILYYDLRLTQIDDIWFWDLYLNGEFVKSGKSVRGIRDAFRRANDSVKPHKIVSAAVNKEK